MHEADLTKLEALAAERMARLQQAGDHTGVLYYLFGTAFRIALLPLLPIGKIYPFRNGHIDFSPFDNESQYELGRTNEVAFPVEYGQTYRIHLVQDETGYHAIPE